MPDTPALKIDITVSVGMDKITNALVGALEGPYSPWMQSFIPCTDAISARLAADARGGEHTVWYNDPAFWCNGGRAQAGYDDPNDDEGEGNGAGRKIVLIHELKAGLAAMALKAPSHFADLIDEKDDAITHDVFMQCVILGEIVYG